jgi:hypothetical protein
MRPIAIVVLLSATSACSSRPAQDASTSASSAPPATSAKAPPVEERDVTISSHYGKKPAKVHGAGPLGWEAKVTEESVEWKLHEDPGHPRVVQVRFGVSFDDSSCDTPSGSCSDADLDKRAAAVFERTSASWLRPNVNTGKPELDAVRATITPIERSKGPNGASIAALRVTYPGLDGPYIPTVVVACSLHRPGDELTLEGHGVAHIDLEKEVVPAMIEACKRMRFGP